MSVSGIYGNSSLDLTSLFADASVNGSDDNNGLLATSNRWLENAQAKKAQSAYGVGAGMSSDIGQAALNKALSEIKTETGKVTFKDVEEHRKNLEEEFSATVRLALMEHGVYLDVDFSLTMTADGNIHVKCDDALVREKIEKYLKDNPKVCEQFGYIQALSNLNRARQSSPAGLQGGRIAKAGMQAQAMEAFFGEAMNAGMNYAALMAEFGQGIGITESASFYAGLDFTV